MAPLKNFSSKSAINIGSRTHFAAAAATVTQLLVGLEEKVCRVTVWLTTQIDWPASTGQSEPNKFNPARRRPIKKRLERFIIV